MKSCFRFLWVVERGQKVENPAELERSTSIARFEPRDRTLTAEEIGLMLPIHGIPKERMKRRNPHLVFLPQQVLDIFIALKTFAGGSDFVQPSWYGSDAPMSAATINQVLTLTYKAAQKDGKSLARFGSHDLRRTVSTLLHEVGYNTYWIEKCMAHEQKGVRAVYNKANTVSNGQ